MDLKENSTGEDISLSKSAMHGLGFRLITPSGQKVWDVNGNPTAEVEVDEEENTSLEEKETSEEETNSEDEEDPKDRREPVPLGRLKQFYA